MQIFCDLSTNTLNTSYRLNINLLWWKLNCRITRMDSGKLHMFTDSIDYDFSILCNSIHLYLLRIFYELRNYDRMVLTDISCQK